MTDPTLLNDSAPSRRTEAQNRASRENGRHSLGAITAQGRMLNSRDPFAHGLYSHLALIPQENRQKFFILRERYFHLLCPSNEVEIDLVERMVAAKWRRMRLVAADSTTLRQEIERQRPSLSPDEPDASRIALALEALAGRGNSQTQFDRLHRRLLSEWDRAFLMLTRLTGRRPNLGSLAVDCDPGAEIENSAPEFTQPVENTDLLPENEPGADPL